LILKKDGHCVIQSVVKTKFILTRSHTFHAFCICGEFWSVGKHINRESNIYPFATCLRYKFYDKIHLHTLPNSSNESLVFLFLSSLALAWRFAFVHVSHLCSSSLNSMFYRPPDLKTPTMDCSELCWISFLASLRRAVFFFVLFCSSGATHHSTLY